MIRAITIMALLTGCTTPDRWSAASHREQMMQCRVSCSETSMASYDSWLAKCTCTKTPPKSDD